MKKALASLCFALTAPNVFAIDATPLFSVYAGGGAWQAEFSGDVGASTTSLADLGLEETETSGYAFLAFEHAVPVIPNFRLEQTSVSISGSGTLTADLVIGGETYSQSIGDVNSDLDFSFTDLGMYYEVAVFDLGVTLRQMSATIDISATDASLDADPISEEVNVVIPLLYLQTRISLPFTGGFITGAANALEVSDNSITDLRAAVGFETELSFLARLALELGYRSFELEISADEDFAANVKLAGPYLGLDVKF